MRLSDRVHWSGHFVIAAVFLAVSLWVLTGCSNTGTGTYQDFGAHVTTMKVLNGIYLINRDGHLLLLSGTEVASQETSQVFLYDIDQRELLFSRRVENSRSMTAFVRRGRLCTLPQFAQNPPVVTFMR